ncbi:TonB-dependent receptor [Asticcacaulis sp. SL142]|uniref:TonB-dependent receptor domain-containing protein n=1 Tax=Asticcacaulis sp. SL142 TaxID=2995155 RepID=UPI00226D1DD6|nr:TonB-dependent receptor [Asticcacaulis sp. SL142]WAC47251.1 TonB-dependent receptor [Asticcacaulis sp. SL142]
MKNNNLSLSGSLAGSRFRALRNGTALSTLAALVLAAPVWAQTQPQTPAQTPIQTPVQTTTPAQAQQPATEKKPEDLKTTPIEAEAQEGPTTTVTVAAERPQNRADRQVFDPKADPDTPTSVVGETLNKLPGVNVDPEGNVTLRGSGVTILVDGKPSAALQGDNRATTLQSLASDDIDSIEIMNNPGAQFSSEGSGGIINIVMKRGRAIVQRPSLTLNGGSNDRYGANLSGGKQLTPKLVINGSIGMRHDGRPNESMSDRTRINELTGEETRSVTQSSSPSLSDMVMMNGGLTYQINDNDSLAANVNYFRREGSSNGVTSSQDYDQNGILTRDYARISRGADNSDNVEGTLRYDHRGDTEGETLKFNLRYSVRTGDRQDVGTTVYALPAVADGSDIRERESEDKNLDFSGDYTHGLWGGDVATGFEIERRENSSRNVTVRTGGTTNIPPQDTRFETEQTISAGYVNYSKAYTDKLSVSSGLRVEQTDFEIKTGLGTKNSYTNVSPSVNVSYVLSQAERLRVGYSRRIRRPFGQELDGTIVYNNDQYASAGNPDLKPQETDKFSVRYEYQKSGHSYNVEAFYSKDSKVIAPVSYFISDTVLLRTRANLGEQQSGGFEASYDGRLTPKLRLRTSGTVTYFEIDSVDRNSVPYVRTGTNVSGRVNLDYDLTAKDRLGLNINTQGKRIDRESYTDPLATLDINYSHKFSNKLNLTMRVSDVLESADTTTYFRSDVQRGYSKRVQEGQIAYLSLRYVFGEVRGNQPDDTQQGPRGPRGNWGGGPGGGGPM